MIPKVSIIVPCYGVEKYLDRCVASLVNQTLREIEIILVDDKSPDRVPEMCDEWATKDSRIKVIHKPVNEGLGFARNTGIEVAVGEYITFIDSDDWVDLIAYETVYNKCKERDFDMCCFQHRRVALDGTILYNMRGVKDDFFDTPERMIEFLMGVIGKDYSNPKSITYGMSSCMAMFRRSIYVESGVRYPSERVFASEDFVFMLYFLPHVKSVCVSSDVFYNYLLNPTSISSTYSEIKHTRLINTLNELNKYCEKNLDWNKCKNHYYSQQMRLMKVILKYTSRSNIPLFEKIKRLSEETRNPLLEKLYNDSITSQYPVSERLYIAMMKMHCGLFFVLLYKFIKRK